MLSVKAGSPGEIAALLAAKKVPEKHSENYTNQPYWFHHKLFSSILHRTQKLCNKITKISQDQALRFTSGSYPYRIQLQFSSVNFFVICALTVAFLETFKHAFLPIEADTFISVILW